ncbi:MAG: hypothetical protein LH702_20005, partial [Phormidesmis sp. CAN_BIN44]|nr:hypothetical protein [Phormidesmis sp. CAN_BIN44]
MINVYSVKETRASRQLHIHSDQNYLPDTLPHIAFLYAFWGRNPEDISNPNSCRYDQYAETGSLLFKISQIEDADLALLPFNWSHIAAHPGAFEIAKQLSQKAA